MHASTLATVRRQTTLTAMNDLEVIDRAEMLLDGKTMRPDGKTSAVLIP
jgi:hypothetical protein